MLHRKSGVIVITSAISQQEINKIRPIIGECILDMFGEVFDDGIIDEIKNGDLNTMNKFRNVQNGFDVPHFGFLYKQYTNRYTTPYTKINNTDTYFTYLPL